MFNLFKTQNVWHAHQVARHALATAIARDAIQDYLSSTDTVQLIVHLDYIQMAQTV